MKSATKFGCMFTMILLFAGFLPISAQEHSLFPQEGLKDVGSGKTGSITMQLTKPFDECLSIENVTFGINQIADVVSGEYHLLDEYKDTEIDLNQITTADQLDTAARTLTKAVSKSELSITTDETGMCTAEDLPVSVYLVYPTDLSNYELIEPFIVAIPTFSETKGVMEYDVSVLPKHSPLPRIRINKTDAKDHQNITGKDFAFTVYSDEECTDRIAVIQSNNTDGTTDYLIHCGSWWIKETKAPEGYHLSGEKIHLELSLDGFYVNDEPVETDENHRYTFSFDNRLIEKPNTGVDTHAPLYLGVLGASMMVIGAIVIQKTRKQ